MNLAYVTSKIDHMHRIGIPAGFGPHGGACPDWFKIAEKERHDNPPVRTPERRKPRDIANGHFGEACQRALREVAIADASDPFAAARLRTQLRNGIEDEPLTVAKRSEAATAQRKVQIEQSFRAWKERVNAEA